MKSSAVSSSGMMEQKRVDIINQSFIKDMNINPCVFQIPKSLRDTKPEAYTPQQIVLGPYRNFRPELVEMKSQKCSAVRKFLNRDQNLAFKDVVVDRMKVLEPIIRACYDEYLDFDGNSLAWIMAVDGTYLLQFVSNYVREHQKYDTAADVDVQSLATDIMMLENQIPMVLLKEICKALQLQSSNPEDNWLLNVFYRFCEEQSPLELSEESEFQSDFGQVHLLDYMYQLIINHQAKKQPMISPAATTDEPKTSDTRPSVFAVAELALETAAAFGIQGAAAVQSNLKHLKAVHQILISMNSQKSDDQTDQAMILGNKTDPAMILKKMTDVGMPSVDEIAIPSVSELCEISKIQFKLTPGGIRDVEFDDKEKIFYLPLLILGSNSEVVLRNLVAYEAESAAPGSTLELAEYVDLMCGIIDTPKDAYLLRKVGIIEGTLTDESIAHIFNGIKKSTGNLDTKSNIDTAIKKVNGQWHYATRRRKRQSNRQKKHRESARSRL